MHDLESNIFCMRYTSHWKKRYYLDMSIKSTSVFVI